MHIRQDQEAPAWEGPVITEEVSENRLGAFGLHRDEFFGEVYWYWWGPEIEWALRLSLWLTPAVVGMCLLAPLFSVWLNRWARPFGWGLAGLAMCNGIALTMGDDDGDCFFFFADLMFVIGFTALLAVRQAQAAWSRWICCLMILACLGWPGAFVEVLDAGSELHHSIGLALAAVTLCAAAVRSNDGLPPAVRLRTSFVLAALCLAALGVFPFYMVEVGHPLAIYFAMPAALLLLTPIGCFERLARSTTQSGAQHV